jgi:hypothetical protein
MAAVVWSAGCTQAAGGEPALPEIDAAGVSRLAARAPNSAVLLFEPTDCLACGANMPRWLAIRRHVPEKVTILVTRAPSPSERIMFARYRIPVDGVLRPGVLPKTQPGGKAFVYSSGQLKVSGRLREPAMQETLARELAQ